MFKATIVLLFGIYLAKILVASWMQGRIYRLGHSYSRSSEPFSFWLLFTAGAFAASLLLHIGYGWMHKAIFAP